jgi:dTDP-6-deoxy-L-talose 4-dehydrogenase (NAD+)
MKVAVTGSTGFIGRHLVAELARHGHALTLLARPTSVVPAEWAQHKVLRQDLLAAPAHAYELLGQPDVLVHLAWGGLPNYKALHHFEHELPLHYRFLKELVGSGLKHVLAVGTCFEYGMQSGALSEDMAAVPTNPYGFAKDALRRHLAYLQSTQPFALTWARLFYMHGAGQSESSLLPKLRAAVARGDSTFPMSGGEQLRDYLPVTQVAALLAALAATGRDDGIVNVCSGQPMSVRRLVEGWIADNHWNITPELGRFPYPDYEPMAFWGDRSKLDRCLGPA